MIKKLLTTIALVVSTSPVYATIERRTDRPFEYETPCVLEASIQAYHDVCKVIDIRTKDGSLKERNILSNKFGLSIRSRFDDKKGFVTWDSHNKYEYKWQYKAGGTGWTYVMPGFLLENISWD